MIKLSHILLEEPIFVPRRLEGRAEKGREITYRKIQEYIKNGSEGDLYLQGEYITLLPDNMRIGGKLLIDLTEINQKDENENYLFNFSEFLDTFPKKLKIEEFVYPVGCSGFSIEAINQYKKDIEKAIKSRGGTIRSSAWAVRLP